MKRNILSLMIIGIFLLIFLSINVNATTSVNQRTIYTNDTTRTGEHGVGVTFTGNYNLISARKSVQSTATQCYVRTAYDGANLTTASFVGDVCTFSVPFAVNSSATYYILENSNGSLYMRTYNNTGPPTLPFTNNGVAWVGSWSHQGLAGGFSVTTLEGFTQVTYSSDQPPTITLNSPVDVFNTTNGTIIFSGTAYDGEGLSNVTFYLNGTLNQTNSSGFNNTQYNFTLTLADGFYNWTMKATDNVSQTTTATTRTFTILPYEINSEIYNPTTSETFSETFSINLSLRSGVTLNSALFNYNGSVYSPIISSGTYIILNRTLIAPNVTSQTNVTFFWELNLSNGYKNTTSHNQTINSLSIDNCLVNTHPILNYTIYDEDARTKLVNTTWNTTSNVFVRLSGDFSGDTYEYYAASVNSNPITICVANALVSGQNYRLDADIQYTADDYVTEYHYIQNYSLNISVAPQNISLYLLLINRSQEFLITYKDSNLIPVEGALIELTRQYLSLGQFLEVEISKTDNDGKTIGHFVLNDEVYTLYVKKNGVLLATFENVRAFCSDIVTGDCRINLNQLGSTTNPSSFVNYLDVIGSETYNDITKVYTFDFTTTDSSTKTINVTIFKYDNYLNDTICSTALSSSSGSIGCTIPAAYYNNTALVRIYVDGELYSSHTFDISISKASQLSSVRFLLAFFLVITIPLLAFTSGPMTLIMYIVGLIAAGGLVLVDWGGFIGPFSAFLWFVVAAIILLIKSASRRQQ